jgi:hypothetical protein
VPDAQALSALFPAATLATMVAASFTPVFDRLRVIMGRHAAGMVVVRDEPGDYHLDTRHVRADGYVLMFGAVQTRARYVSYHLMPLAYAPDRLGASPALQARMQGKACLNFARIDDDLFAELDVLTGRAVTASDAFAFPAR